MERIVWSFFLIVLVAGFVPRIAFCDTPRVVISEPPDPLAGETIISATPTPEVSKPIRPFSFGVKAGFFWGMQNYPADSFEPVNYGTSPIVGVFVDKRVFDSLSLQVEANYLQKGSGGYNLAGNYTGVGTYGYIEFPLLLRFEGQLTKNTTFYLLLGPSVLFLLSQSDIYTYPNGGSLTASHTTGVPGTDYDYCLGIGIEIKEFSVELRVGGDFTPSAEIFADGTISYSNFSSIEVGYRLF